MVCSRVTRVFYAIIKDCLVYISLQKIGIIKPGTLECHEIRRSLGEYATVFCNLVEYAIMVIHNSFKKYRNITHSDLE